jgi:hypothetical protein
MVTSDCGPKHMPTLLHGCCHTIEAAASHIDRFIGIEVPVNGFDTSETSYTIKPKPTVVSQ